MTFICDAATFDGTNDWLSRGSGLTGISDGSQGMISVFYQPGTDNVEEIIFDNDIESVRLRRNGDNTIEVRVISSIGEQFKLTSTGTVLAGSYTHILAGWNTNFASGSKLGYLYLNDVSDIGSTVDLDAAFNVDYATDPTNWFIGTADNIAPMLASDLSELYFNSTATLNFSITANRRKFVTAGLKPVDLGSDGSTPTGSQPIVYLHLDDGETANNFALNAGSGGDFTVTGALTTASTSPSDGQVIPPGPPTIHPPPSFFGGGARETPDYERYLSSRRKFLADNQVRAEADVEQRMGRSMLAAIAEIQRREHIEDAERRRKELEREAELKTIQERVERIKADAHAGSPEGIIEAANARADMEINRRWTWPEEKRQRRDKALRQLAFLNLNGGIARLVLRGDGPSKEKLQELMAAKMRQRFPTKGQAPGNDDRLIREITAMIENADRVWYESLMGDA